MQLADIKLIGVVGGGVMGGGIGQAFAQGGYRVIIREINDEMAEKTRHVIEDGRWGIKAALQRGKLTAEQAEAAMQGISYSTRLEDLADCDFVVEAIPEKLDLKQSEFIKIDRAVKPAAILATNTSGFPMVDVAVNIADTRRPRFIGTHWFSPAMVMKVVEVVVAPFTAEETFQTVMALHERIGKVPVRVKDAPGTYGFVGNRVYFAAVQEAEKVINEGLCTPEDLDKVMTLGYGWPVGPYAMIQGARGGWGERAPEESTLPQRS